MNTEIITIDGPAGAGKTTVSKRLSQRLGCIYVDTGALYRGVAYELIQQGIDWKNDMVLADFLQTIDLGFVMKDDTPTLVSSRKNITPFIRTPDVTMLASASSAKPQVRAALLDIQRNIAKKQDAVFEGRDMGTAVFPNADYKFFLTADLNIRAKRRFNELPANRRNLEKVQSDMALRDRNDSERASAPLKPAEDAIKIDSSGLTVEQVVEKMISHIEKA